jgi:DNA-directed RNA polymerase subunit RPC12/RpoP
MAKIFCSVCGTKLEYILDSTGLDDDYIVIPCPRCAHKFIDVNDRLPKKYEIVIVRFDVEPFFSTGYCNSNGDWCTDDSRLDEHVINWANIPPIVRITND